MTTDETPLEAGLGFAVKLDTETPFLGREALLRQRETGMEKRLFVLTVQNPDVFPAGGEPVLLEGAPIGQLTSVAYGHTVGCAVGLGYLRLDGLSPKQMAARTGLTLDLAGDLVPVTASLRAPYDPTGARMRA